MDASTLLEQYTQDLSNLPAELAHLLEELRENDLKFYDTRKRIQQRDAQLHKYIKQHGSLVPHPKEELIYSKINEDFEKAKKLQEEKTILANTALFLISKHLVRLEKDIERLENDGVIPKMEIEDEELDNMDDINSASSSLSSKMNQISNQISQTNLSDSPINKKNHQHHQHHQHHHHHHHHQQNLKKSRQGTPSSSMTPNPVSSSSSMNIGSSNNGTTLLSAGGNNINVGSGGSLPRRKIKTEDTEDMDMSSSSRSGSKNGHIRTNSRNSALLEHGASGTVSIPMKGNNNSGTNNNNNSSNNNNNNTNINNNGNNNTGGGNEEDELYCFCQQVSYGNMIACDNDNCKFEWFHYDCVGLKEPPQGIWYCPDCTKEMELNNNHKRKDKKRK